MKSIVLLLTIALSSLVFAGIILDPYHTPNPNNIWKKVYFGPLRTLDYAGNHIAIQNLKYKSIFLSLTLAITPSHTAKSKFCILIMLFFQSGGVDILLSVLPDSTHFLSKSRKMSKKLMQLSIPMKRRKMLKMNPKMQKMAS